MRTDFQSLLDSDFSDESQSPVVLSGRELEELVSPVSCEEFANSYFSRLSLYVKGHPDKFDHIFGFENLKQALARGRKVEDKRFNLTASFAGGEESGSPKPMSAANIDQVGELLKAGATICVTNIHMADPCLARWAQAVREQLNFTGTVGVNCYVSGDGGGLPMHFDKRVATTLQIAGKKRWKFSTTAAKAWPDHNGLYKDGRVEPVGPDNGKLPDEMEFREVELSPGDLLCLPAGAWHAARGVGFSLALNIYFAPRNLFDPLAPLFQEFAASNANWRGGPPVTVEKTQGKMPNAVSEYMRERIDEFHMTALKLLEQDALGATWLTSLTDKPYTGWQPDPVATKLPRATSEDRFRVAKPLRFIETQDKVIVPCDYGLLKFPLAFAPIFHRLSSETAPFSVPEVLSWRQEPDSPSQQEIVSQLQALYGVGFLQMA
jgi:ribosomal protein L16 Arg81 hydroxylase